MANLSNINNKFLFTDGDFLKIGNLAPINNISGTESGISITNSNVASITLDNTAASGKRYIMYSSGNGSLVFWDGDAGSARLQIDSAGNSTFAGTIITPQINLHGVGTTYLNIGNATTGTASSDGASIGFYTGQTSLQIINRENDAIVLSTNNSPSVTILGNGNVGIGTDSPNAPLQIASTNKTINGSLSGSNLSVYTTDTQAANVGASIGLGGMSTTPAGFEFYGTMAGRKENSTNLDSSGYLAFYTQRVAVGHVERMRIDSLGNVGIGTTSPVGDLHLQGGQQNIVLTNTSADGVAGLTISRIIGQARGYSNNLSVMQSIDFETNSSFWYKGDIVFKTNNTDGTDTTVAASERMRIFSNGNVNIGVAEAGASAVTGPFVVTHTSSRFLTSSYEESAVSLSAKNGNNNLETLRLAGDSIKFFNGTNAVGSQKMVILNNGNVGIGTTSPGRGLTIDRSNEYAAIEIIKNNTGNQIAYLGTGSSGTTDNGILQLKHGGTNIVQLYTTGDSYFNGGNVGIGVTGPGTKLDIAVAPSAPWMKLINEDEPAFNLTTYNNGTNNGSTVYAFKHGLYYGSTENAAIAFYRGPSSVGGFMAFTTDNGTERMRITSAGTLLINKTTNVANQNGWDLSAAGFMTGTCNFSSTNEMIVLNQRDGLGTTKVDFRNGQVSRGNITWTSSATSFNTSSDYRLKENVVEMTGALDRVSQLKPSRFNFIADSNTTVDGFLAHEVQEIVPEAITGEKDAIDKDGNPDYQGIDQSKLVPLLVAAIQELKAEIDELKKK